MNAKELARAPPSLDLSKLITSSHPASAPSLYHSTPSNSTKATYRSSRSGAYGV